jgi:hypothetical protein
MVCSSRWCELQFCAQVQDDENRRLRQHFSSSTFLEKSICIGILSPVIKEKHAVGPFKSLSDSFPNRVNVN